ncbi:MAG: tetratricopeptide repeat protein [Planctomycetota bacterium]|nr:MAG: tetratricopeptide repeat protein [Planctomycetota bacterium]
MSWRRRLITLCLVPCACNAAPRPDARASPPAQLDDLPPLLRPQDPELLSSPGLARAMTLLRSDAGGAAMALEQLQQQFPGHAELASVHAWVLLVMGDAAAAERTAEDLWRLAGSPGVPLQAAGRAPEQASYVLGLALARRERWDEADPWLQRALRAAPGDPALLEAAVRSAFARGDGLAALEPLEGLRLLRPDDPELDRWLARAQLLAGRFSDAEAQYRRLLAREPGSAELWEGAGLAAFRSGTAGEGDAGYRRAAECFAAAAEHEPMNARLRFNRGCALDWARDLEAAERAYREALELHPGYLEAAENLAALLQAQERVPEAVSVLRELLRQPLTAGELSRLSARISALEAVAGTPLGRRLPR